MDSAAAVSALGKHDYIGYNVEVVDNTTGDILGMIAKNSITSSSVHPLKTSSYQLNTAGLTGKTLRVKILVKRLTRTENPSVFGADFSLHNDPAERYKLIKEFVDDNFSRVMPGAKLKIRFQAELAKILQ